MTPAAATPAGLRVLLVLSTLLGFASISTDLHLPALPAMAASLRADPGMIELTIAGYLAGFGAGQLLWGPIGDRYGRRGPVAAGLVLFVIGSAGCAVSASVWQMIGWRLVQATGACSGVVLARAIQYGSGMAGSALVGAFADGTPGPMGWVIALGGIGSAACVWLLLPTPAAAGLPGAGRVT